MGSYRPISLLPNISKIFEILLNKALLKYSNDKDIVPDAQFGFRFKHSAIHAVNKFASDVSWALNDKQFTGACLIDLEKAFDTVWLDGLFFRLIKKGFPSHLIRMLWTTLHGKKIFIFDNENKSEITFELKEGLQQGAVNSPLLFNIYICDLLRMYGINTKPNIKGIAFADDIIIYVNHRCLHQVQVTLQEIFRNVNSYFETWRLKCNYRKSETILIRPRINDLNKKYRKVWRDFNIKPIPNNDLQLEHNSTVKYLGIHLNELLKYNNHINIAINRAKKAYFNAKSLFHSAHLNPKVKVVCYMLLVRPILTYGCQIWYNVSPSTMEKLRIFERNCLRACLKMYKTPESNYERHFSNKKLYDKANIPRIDNFILKLNRDHIASASMNKENPLIFGAFYHNPNYYAKSLKTGYIPPEAFTYLDSEGFIQDKNNVPIIYHVYRHAFNGKILYEPNQNCLDYNDIRFSTSLPNRDIKDKHRKNFKRYWWLADNQ